MTDGLDTFVAGGFLIFARVGGCLMTLPGYGGERIPVRVRLYISIGVAAAVAVQLWGGLETLLRGATLATLVSGVATEIVVGVLLGLTCRFFMLAIDTMLTAATMSIGLGNAFGAPIDEAAPAPALTTLVLICVTTLIFVLDLHLELIKGLRQSYDVIGASMAPSPHAMLLDVTKSLDHAYIVVFRICSPFLLFGLTTNVGVGLLNKTVSQIPIYFVSTPFLITFGIYWMYYLSPELLAHLMDEYGAWITRR